MELRHDVLRIIGLGMLAVGVLGLVTSVSLGGINPSLWFVMSAHNPSNTISGWTITALLMAMVTVGVGLTTISHRRSRN